MNSTGSVGGRGQKILVVQTSFLGDVVLTTPLLAEIRRRMPESYVALLCTPDAKSIVEGNPDINEVIVDDKKGAGKGWRGLRRKARELRERGFTMAICPHKSLRSALLLFLAGIPCRIGFRQSAGWFLYHKRVERDGKLHDVERNLSLLEPLGFDPAASERHLRIEPDARARASVERVLSSLGVERDGLIFGINPGSVWPTKRWKAEGYAELMVRLKERHRCRILLFGGPEDRGTVNQIQELSGHLGVSLAGRISLGEFVCALEWCDLFITNDSGPMHMAVARGIPVVAIFCATTPSLGFYPYSFRAVVVEKDLPCRPCTSHGGRRCPLGTEDCMRLIEAQDVLRGVELLLSRRGSGSHPNRPRMITL